MKIIALLLLVIIGVVIGIVGSILYFIYIMWGSRS